MKPDRPAYWLLGWMILAASAPSAFPGPATNRSGILVLEIENDIFGQQDRYYTSGLRLSWFTVGDRSPAWIRRGMTALPFVSGTGDPSMSYSIGQNVYTPGETRTPAPDPEDRPYAGWLYVTLGMAEEIGEKVDRIQLTAGVIGPAALADRTQRELHRLFGAHQPEGWDAQLRNEPTLMLSYERQWRAWVSTGEEGWAVDVTPHFGGAAGTPFTKMNSGLVLRAGRHLPRDYGPPRIQPALPGSGLFHPTERRGGYLFAGVDGIWMIRNVFLDGNTWKSGPSVEKHPLVGELQVGAALTVRQTRLAYTHVFRSKEFKGQSSRQNFGAVSLSMRF